MPVIVMSAVARCSRRLWLIAVTVGFRSKVAVTVVFPVIVKVQVLVLLTQPPVNPAATEFEAGAAVRVTEVPLVKDTEQVGGQTLGGGIVEMVTLPPPVPASKIVSTGVTVIETVAGALVSGGEQLGGPPVQPSGSPRSVTV